MITGNRQDAGDGEAASESLEGLWHAEQRTPPVNRSARPRPTVNVPSVVMIGLMFSRITIWLSRSRTPRRPAFRSPSSVRPRPGNSARGRSSRRARLKGRRSIRLKGRGRRRKMTKLEPNAAIASTDIWRSTLSALVELKNPGVVMAKNKISAATNSQSPRPACRNAPPAGDPAQDSGRLLCQAVQAASVARFSSSPSALFRTSNELARCRQVHAPVRPSLDHEDPVARASTSSISEETMMMPLPAREIENEPLDLGLRADVDASRRLVEK